MKTAYRVKASPAVGIEVTYKRIRGRKRRVKAYTNAKGRPCSSTPYAIASFIHNGKLVEEGEIVYSSSDLEKAFPLRFEKVKEEDDQNATNREETKAD